MQFEAFGETFVFSAEAEKRVLELRLTREAFRVNAKNIGEEEFYKLLHSDGRIGTDLVNEVHRRREEYKKKCREAELEEERFWSPDAVFNRCLGLVELLGKYPSDAFKDDRARLEEIMEMATSMAHLRRDLQSVEQELHEVLPPALAASWMNTSKERTSGERRKKVARKIAAAGERCEEFLLNALECLKRERVADAIDYFLETGKAPAPEQRAFEPKRVGESPRNLGNVVRMDGEVYTPPPTPPKKKRPEVTLTLYKVGVERHPITRKSVFVWGADTPSGKFRLNFKSDVPTTPGAYLCEVTGERDGITYVLVGRRVEETEEQEVFVRSLPRA